MTDVWVANDQGNEIVRARDIAVVSLDYNGNVNVRLAGVDGPVVTVVAHRAHHEERRRRFSSPAHPRHRRTVRRGRNLPGAGGARRDARLAVGYRAAVMTSLRGAYW